MERWYRVFGGAVAIDPQSLIASLHAAGITSTADIQSDADGWFRVEFTFPDDTTLSLDRYRADEDGIRAELNSWAAWVESHGDNPASVHLMERLIQSAQLFVFAAAGDIPNRASEVLARFLAARTSGLCQIDGLGLFAAEGTIMLAE